MMTTSRAFSWGRWWLSLPPQHPAGGGVNAARALTAPPLLQRGSGSRRALQPLPVHPDPHSFRMQDCDGGVVDSSLAHGPGTSLSFQSTRLSPALSRQAYEFLYSCDILKQASCSRFPEQRSPLKCSARSLVHSKHAAALSVKTGSLRGRPSWSSA